MDEAALVTGASRGIGYELARQLAHRGTNLILVSRSEDLLRDHAQQFQQEFGIKTRVLALDLSNKDSTSDLYNQIGQEEIHVHTLINNAGFGLHGAFDETDWAREESMIQLNVTTLTHLTKLFLSPMRVRGEGRILNVASTASFVPGPYMSIYYATKAYVLSFTEALSYELSDTDIKVSCLCPGVTKTGFQEEANLDETGLVDRLPSFVVSTPKQVARYGLDSLDRNQTVAVHGWINTFMVWMLRFLPRVLIRTIVGSAQEKSGTEL